MVDPPAWLRTLASRYDPDVFAASGQTLRVRLATPDEGAWDVVVAHGLAAIRSADGPPDAVITADEPTWCTIVTTPRDGIEAYLSGRLSVRRNLHVGVGFLAATSASTNPARMRFRCVETLSLIHI